WDKEAGEDLKWNKNFDGIQDINVSAIYFEIKGVSIYNQKDYEQIYDFFVKKMTILEDIYFEYKEVLSYQISQLN
ncbi:MAG: DUF4268 domain-containing protein, partial [Bacteroidales bacterium]|nr:DUF4268 domain-containing protein [Bacteroidales bacterium]